MQKPLWVGLVGLGLVGSCGDEHQGVTGGFGGYWGAATGDGGGAAGASEAPGAAGGAEVMGSAGGPAELCVCTTPLHCKSRVCTNGFCEPTRCFDGVLNGSETDVDCGGPGCLPCAPAARCVSGGDCASGGCRCGQCTDGGASGDDSDPPCTTPPGCDDGIQNLDESDVDCGGSCTLCAADQRCFSDSDCESGSCRFLIARPLVCGDVKACE